MNRMSRRILAACMISLLLALAVSSAHAQDPTVEPTPIGSGSQLSLAYDPTLGFHVMPAGPAPGFYSGNGVGGGTTYISLGSPCANGYTSVVASLGAVWVVDSGPLTITFAATQPDTTVGLLLYDLLAGQFYCSTELSSVGTLEFTNLGKGVYFIWGLNAQALPVTGKFGFDQSSAAPAAAPTSTPLAIGGG